MKFQTIVADPPWHFDDRLPGPGRGAEKHYPTMSGLEICAYMRHFIDEAGPDIRLFLWRTASHVEIAYWLISALGLVPKAEIVWLKKTPTGKRHFGMGRTVRNEHETCIIAQRGKPLILSHSIRSTFEAPTGIHSEKPEAFFDIVEQLSPGPYLELFPRSHTRNNWTAVFWPDVVLTE